jgi:hypothetical protein
VDFRIMRDFALFEKYHLQFLGEAFNLFNHTNIFSVNGTQYNYVAAGSSNACPSTAGISGCLSPNAAFYAPTSSTSSSGLYGARQLQVSAKFVF